MKNQLLKLMILFALVCVAGLHPAQALAQWGPEGNVVVSGNATWRAYPRTVSDGAGGAIILYENFDTEPDLYIQRINAVGAVQWGGNGNPIATEVGFQTWEDIVADGAGGAIMTWTDTRTGTSEAYIQKVDSFGTIQWGNNGREVNYGATNSRIALDGTGGFYLAWEEAATYPTSIVVQKLGSGGWYAWPDYITIGGTRDPRIIPDGAGGLVAGWREYVSPSLHNYVRGQRLDPGGRIMWSSNAVSSSYNCQFQAQIASDGTGGGIWVWLQGTAVIAQRVDGTGIRRWGTGGISAFKGLSAPHAEQVISDGAGGALIVVQEGTTGGDVYLNRILADGSYAWSNTGVVVCKAAGTQSLPQLAPDGHSGAYVVWLDDRDVATNSQDIYVQYVSSTGVIRWAADGVRLSPAAGNQYYPQITATGASSAIVTWGQGTWGTTYGTDLYAQKINANGSIGDPPPFVDIGAGLTAVSSSSVAWGDYDNDGDLDILLAGDSGAGFVSQVYRNDAGVFVDIGAGLVGVREAGVAWGDFDNDNDLDILLTGDLSGPGYTSKIYRNNGGTFSDIGAALTRVWLSSVAWGDCDNDGDQDILLSGSTGPFRVSKVYRNHNGGFSDIGAGLTGVSLSSVAWGDYDNDGDLDILQCGASSLTAMVSQVYANDASVFTDTGAGLTAVYGAVDWGDFDNDGILDILLAGITDSLDRFTKVYQGNWFHDMGAGLPGLHRPSVVWGDSDNDGDLDMLLTGSAASGSISKVYRNNGDALAEIASDMTGVWESSAAWGDYDNDGDLDILISGSGPGNAPVTKIYRNDISAANTPPTAPGNPTSYMSGTRATMSWDAATDAETAAPGLTYNLRIGSSPGLSDVFSGMADPATGYRKVVQMGNTNHNLAWGIDLPGPGTYYWAVQAVDVAFKGGPFSAEQVMEYSPNSFSELATGLPGVNGSTVAWGDYDADGDLDVLLGGNTGSTYISRVFRNDGGTFVDIGAGLAEVGANSAGWGDYDSDGDLDILICGRTGPATRVSLVYRNDGGAFSDIGAGLPGAFSGAWGDFDNDGDLDILLVGDYVFQVLRNDSGTFTDIGAGFPSGFWGRAVWGDYDNDGDLDILFAGEVSSPASRVYRNDGGTFVDIAAGLTPVIGTSLAWGDFDNDGDLDILLSGRSAGSSPVSKVYRNDGGAFVDIAAGLTPVDQSSLTWGDYDNDGDLDILLTGSDLGGSPVSEVYRNDGGAFTRIGAGLTRVRSSSGAWGDYDNDGDLDILLAGLGSGSTNLTLLYRNNAATANTPPAAPSNLSNSFSGTTATFSWDAATDLETASPGLTYNLRIGTAFGAGDVFSGMSDQASGYRRVPALGNTNHNTSWAIDLQDIGAAPFYWSVQAVDAAYAGSPFASYAMVSPVDDSSPIPVRYALHVNYPNPFNPSTRLRFDLPAKSTVSLRIYDVSGRLIRTLLAGSTIEAGIHVRMWNGEDESGRQVPSGVYFGRLQADQFEASQRMVLLK